MLWCGQGFPKLARKILKALLAQWAGNDEHSRILAFIVIRRLAVVSPYPFIELCLKGMYLGFVRNARFVNAAKLPFIQVGCSSLWLLVGVGYAPAKIRQDWRIANVHMCFLLYQFLANSVVELYMLDDNSSYQHAFVYIRQLAINLRNALTLKKKDSFRQVYNWQ